MIMRALPGRMISLFSERCYGATMDCGEVAVSFFGVQRRKLTVSPLGVDTSIFYPAGGDKREERKRLRRELGIADNDIVCIYTGRFTEEKNPALLCEAVDRLACEGKPFRSLFIGQGPQKERLKLSSRSVILNLRPVGELGLFYRASDIGVWPTQESTSMIDAAACGLPIVVNDTLRALERIEGNGLSYKLNDLEDLTTKLRQLEDLALRAKLGKTGAEKMRKCFSWESIARSKLDDYERSLTGRRLRNNSR